MNALKLLGATLLIMIGVLLLAVVGDVCFPLEQAEEEQITFTIYPEVAWEDDINNPDNQPFVLEVAFNEGCEVDDVTQEMFNKRYLEE